MEISRLSSNFYKTQFLKFQRKSRACSSVTLGSVQRRAPLSCCPVMSSFRRQLVCKIKSRWRQALGWQRSTPQYSYDLRSYCLNFDDGPSNAHIPPRVC